MASQQIQDGEQLPCKKSLSAKNHPILMEFGTQQKI